MMAVQNQIMQGPPQTMGQNLLQGLSNILRNYPGHNIHHFFGDAPMTAAQFFILNEQLQHEQDLMEKESKSKK